VWRRWGGGGGGDGGIASGPSSRVEGGRGAVDMIDGSLAVYPAETIGTGFVARRPRLQTPEGRHTRAERTCKSRGC
jgi:hypothetical protein